MNDININEKGEYLEAQLSGEFSAQLFIQQLGTLLGICIEKKAKKLLIDLYNITGTISVLDRFDGGAFATKFVGHVGRVAVVAPADQIYFDKVGISVAQNGGLDIDLFDDKKHALDWLLKN